MSIQTLDLAFCVQDLNSNCTALLTVRWDKLLLRMMSEFMFKCDYTSFKQVC